MPRDIDTAFCSGSASFCFFTLSMKGLNLDSSRARSLKSSLPHLRKSWSIRRTVASNCACTGSIAGAALSRAMAALAAMFFASAWTAGAVCQADYNRGVHPGRVVGDNCVIGYGGREYGVAGGRVLIAKPEKVRWAAAAPNTPIKGQAVVGGGEAGRPLVVCRARQDNVLYAGKMVDGRCNIGLGGRELALQPFELLVSQ